MQSLFVFELSKCRVRSSTGGQWAGNGSTESHLTSLEHNFVFRNKEYSSIFPHFVVSFIILYAYIIIIVYLHFPPYIGFATFIRFSTETWPGLAYLARPRATAGTPQWVLPCVQPGQTQDAQDQRGKPYVMRSCDAKPPLIPC